MIDLEQLTDLLQEEHIDAHFMLADERLPTDRVEARLLTDEGADLSLQIVQIPRLQEDVALYQLYAPLPEVAPDDAAVVETMRLLSRLNMTLSLPAFNIHPVEHFVYYRYVMVVTDSDDAAPALIEAVWMMYYALDNLANDILAVVRGEKRADEALAGQQSAISDLSDDLDSLIDDLEDDA